MERHRLLRLLSVRDQGLFSVVDEDEQTNAQVSELDRRTCALVRLGALVAIDGALPSYVHAVENARAAGASDDEIVGAMVAVIPTTGGERAVSAAPKLALALGYDVDAELEAAD